MDQTIPQMFRRIANEFPDHAAQYSKDASGTFQMTSYRLLYEEVRTFAGGLASLGVKKGDHVGHISDNRKEWLIADLATMMLGAADVPRGCDSMGQELAFILRFADVETTFAETRSQVEKILHLLDDIPPLKRIICLDKIDPTSFSPSRPIDIMSFQDVMDLGGPYLAEHGAQIDSVMDTGKRSDLATIIFTSGTTGEPKGVMLSHGNLLHQVDNVNSRLHSLKPGDIWLAVLPVWHSFERIMQYIALGAGTALAYSKPVGKIMLADFATIRPTWMASVPRIWESVRAGVYRTVKSGSAVKRALFNFFVAIGKAHAYLTFMIRGLLPQFKKRIRPFEILVAIVPWLLLWPLRLLGNVLVFKTIRAKLGGRFVAGISGGGALPPTVDWFFASAGILLLEGYGLTETAPVLSVRDENRPIVGTIGNGFPGTEFKIVDDSGNTLPPGQKGLILARGPQVMLGYYKRPEETTRMIDKEGWLNTGDLGIMTHRGAIRIVGRAKDTIVLLGGENIEPLPIEDRLRDSPFIDQVMVVGQDQRSLGCLIVPNREALEQWASEQGVPVSDYEALLQSDEVGAHFREIVNDIVNARNGFKMFERISGFSLLAQPFEIGKELSAKQEMKRHVIADLYEKQIKAIFDNRR